jgi:threonine 3-dehydrogenase
MDTMKAWVFQRKEGEAVLVDLQDVPVPEVPESYVLLRVLGTSVCGTDEHMFVGENEHTPDGTIPGHEFFGEIVELGKGAKGLKKGQKVAGESHYFVDGCDGDGVIGFQGPRGKDGKRIPPIHGAYAEYIAIPDYCANVLPEGPIMTEFWPSLLEGLGNDYFIGHWLKQESLMKGNTLVVGSGPHGLFTQMFLKLWLPDSSKLVAFEVDPYRRGYARGAEIADAVINSLEPDARERVGDAVGATEFDVVVDTAGMRQSVLDMSLDYTKDGGTLILFGLYSDLGITLNGRAINDLIFDMSEITVDWKGKKVKVKGITGREGIWQSMIKDVNETAYIREKVMHTCEIKGPLENLREDTLKLDRELMKRAYRPFGG